MLFNNVYHIKCTVDGFSIFFLCLLTIDYEAINALLNMYLLVLYFQGWTPGGGRLKQSEYRSSKSVPVVIEI